ncbi:MAG: glycosyltransferase [Fibrobacterota bacterium]
MKKVLVISYYFPPAGGPGVQRVLKFVKYLPEFGYMPVVVCGPESGYSNDNSLIKDIPAGTKLYRISDPGVFIPGEIRKLLRFLFIPDRQSFWSGRVSRKLKNIMQREKPDIIFSSSPPHSIHEAARRASEASGIPFIADFRDEWSSDPDFERREAVKKQMKMETGILEECSALTTVTEDAVRNFTEKGCSRAYLVHNGYDMDDMGTAHAELSKNESEKLEITYSGRFTRKSTPLMFLNSLQTVIRKKPEFKRKIIITIAGPNGNRKWVENFPELEDVLNFPGYLPHERCIELMKKSDILLLLCGNTEKSEILPAKMFEYMALGKPVLASVRYKKECSEILNKYGRSFIMAGEDPEMLGDFLEKSLSNKSEGKELLPARVNMGFIETFSRRRLTEKLAGIFDEFTGEKK